MNIRPAQASEATFLTNLAERSKGYWRYPDRLMQIWKDEGAFTVSPEMCVSGLVRVVIGDDGENPIGYYRLSGEPPKGKLSDLWVDPNHIGTGEGIGKILLGDAIIHAVEIGMSSLIIHSDPNAAGFYEHAGAEQIGETEPHSITGRTLPKFELRL